MEIHLRDGARITIREIRPQDKGSLACGHGRLSPESVRRRYLAAKPQLSRAELRYLTEVDGHDHVALVALPANNPDCIAAVARFVRDGSDPALAEFAFVVADAYQGRGLGTALARMLVREARERGIRRLRAVALADNVPARRLLATIARDLHAQPTGAGATEVMGRLAA